MHVERTVADSPRPNKPKGPQFAVPCGGCGSEFNWRPPMVGRPVRLVACCGCGRPYFGAQDCDVNELHSFIRGEADDAGSWQDQVRMLKDAFQPIKPNPAVDARPSVLHKMMGVESAFSEQRRCDRRATRCAIVGVPLDAEGRPAGAAIDLRVLNISSHGASLGLQGDLMAPRLALDFSSLAEIAAQSLVKIVWMNIGGDSVQLGVELLNRPYEALATDLAENPSLMP